MFGLRKQRKLTIHEHWQWVYSRGGVGSHEEVLKNNTIWKDWPTNLHPEKQASRGIMKGIEILCGSDNWSLSKRFLECSRDVIEGIIRQDLLARAELYFPRNRAELYRGQVYVNSLLGQAWDHELLLLASRDLEDDATRRYPDSSDWDFLPQFQYITAIHLALLASDIERAKWLIDNPPCPLDVYVEHVELLKGLIRLATNQLTNDERADFLIAYDRFFDKLRDPRWRKQNGFTADGFGQIEFSLLREKYIRHPESKIDWRKAIAEFSKA